VLSKTQIRIASGATLCTIAFLSLQIRLFESVIYSDAYCKRIARSSAWCHVKLLFNPHNDCAVHKLVIMETEWACPVGYFPGYWRDPDDGAMLFGTQCEPAGVAQLHLFLPAERKFYSTQLQSAGFALVGGGDDGKQANLVTVKRRSMREFELAIEVLMPSRHAEIVTVKFDNP